MSSILDLNVELKARLVPYCKSFLIKYSANCSPLTEAIIPFSMGDIILSYYTPKNISIIFEFKTAAFLNVRTQIEIENKCSISYKIKSNTQVYSLPYHLTDDTTKDVMMFLQDLSSHLIIQRENDIMMKLKMVLDLILI